MKNPFRKSAEPPDVLSGAPPPSPLAREGWHPTHRHKKGGLYRLICFGTDEATRTPVAIYDDSVGTVWVRDAAEFEDGRFTHLDAQSET